MDEHEIYGRIEKDVHFLAESQQIELTNRRELLWGHAAMGIGVGIFMLWFGLSKLFEAWLGYQGAYVAAVVPIVGGTILAYGLAGKKRKLRLELFGLVILLIWDLLMVAALFFSPLRDSRLWPVPVYLILGYFMVVHMRPIVKYLRRGL